MQLLAYLLFHAQTTLIFAYRTKCTDHLPEGGSEVVFTTCEVTAMLVPAAAAS